MLNCRAQMLYCFYKIKLLLQFILYAIFQRFPAAQKLLWKFYTNIVLYENLFVRKSFMTFTLACRILIKIFCKEFYITMLTVRFYKNLFWLCIMLNSFWVLIRTFCSFLFYLFFDKIKLRNLFHRIDSQSILWNNIKLWKELTVRYAIF